MLATWLHNAGSARDNARKQADEVLRDPAKRRAKASDHHGAGVAGNKVAESP